MGSQLHLGKVAFAKSYPIHNIAAYTLYLFPHDFRITLNLSRHDDTLIFPPYLRIAKSNNESPTKQDLYYIHITMVA